MSAPSSIPSTRSSTRWPRPTMSGEFEVEQFYVDRRLNDAVTVRAGLFLMPFGLLNENHEPTNFYGVQRNFVETLIIPSTWREGGFNLHGDTAARLWLERRPHHRNEPLRVGLRPRVPALPATRSAGEQRRRAAAGDATRSSRSPTRATCRSTWRSATTASPDSPSARPSAPARPCRSRPRPARPSGHPARHAVGGRTRAGRPGAGTCAALYAHGTHQHTS